jgi:dTMP kinase
VSELALRAGSWVLCDRFASATLAYQGYGRGIDLDLLRSLAAIAARGREPEVTQPPAAVLQAAWEELAAKITA